MTKTLKSIAPLQCGKITGALYGLFGLVFIPILVILATIGTIVKPTPQSSGSASFAIGGAFVLSLIVPVILGVFGFIFGAISAALYNLIARWIGGMEVEVE